MTTLGFIILVIVGIVWLRWRAKREVLMDNVWEDFNKRHEYKEGQWEKRKRK